MKTIFYLLLIFLLATSSSYAQKHFHQWPFGYGASLENGFGISILDFNDDIITTFPYSESELMVSDDASSFICNADGELLLLSNGCKVFNANLDVIEGADTLAPGLVYNTHCNDFQEYPSGQCTLFLPDFSNDTTFYLLHKNVKNFFELQEILSTHFYLSTIIQREDGSFYLKEKKVLQTGQSIPRSRTATLHAGQQRWWTFNHEAFTNKFDFFLINDTDTSAYPISQEIGPPLSGTTVDIGQSAFSPDNNLLALNTAA